LLSRSFELTEPALEELRRRGLGPDLVKALRALLHRRFPTRGEFLAVLGELSPAPATPEERKLILKHSRLGWIGLERLIPNRAAREWVEALIFALVIASVVRTFLFAPFKIPSGSMIPTIEIGDHIFATMYSYGLPIPFTETKLFPQPVKRGDIIIFPYPLDPAVDYIKRVIALGGETVEVRGTEVRVDGRTLEEPYAFYDPRIVEEYRRQGRSLPSFGPERIPEGHVFVMGDNRLNSSDSRVWGYVPAGAIKGKGQIVYWSHDPRAGWLGGYQPDRIGTLLQ
jgi:signal peptidase I